MNTLSFVGRRHGHRLLDMSWRGHRGRGGYRGHRRGQGEGQYGRDYSEDGAGGWERPYHGGQRSRGPRRDHGYDEGEPRRFRGRGRPDGLRGKEIGLFYAKRSKMKKEREEIMNKPVVTLGGQEANIRRLLDDMNTADSEDPQPGFSGAQGSRYESGGRPKSSYSEYRTRGKDQHRPQTAHATSSTSSANQFGDPNSNTASKTADEELEGVPNLEEIWKVEREELDGIYGDEKDNAINEVVEGSVCNRDSALDQALLRLRDKNSGNPKFQEMMEFRKKLPAYDKMQEVVEVVESNQVVVISGETGCGKTTQVPQFILDQYISQGRGSECRLVCTQPRRISAVSVAERVANERVEKLTESVGYSIRLESKLPRTQGSILFCTTGVVLRFLELDPMLQRASHIIIDEIHERDLQSDFLMIILKDLLPRRPDLKVILMSATLNAEQFSNYFHNCPHLSIPGFTYPVKEYYLEDVLELTRYRPPEKKVERLRGPRSRKFEAMRDREEEEWNLQTWCRNHLEGSYSQDTIDSLQRMDLEMKKLDLDLIHQLIELITFSEKDGAILVFLPGWKEISDLHKLLTKNKQFNSRNSRVIPLHSMMPTMNQKEVFDRPPEGVRKIIIATNIAETSITIDDVVYVIDCGKIKVKDFEPEFNLTTLEPQWVAKSNAKQRKGRAGRVQPGKCYHLYTSLKEHDLADYQRPEILRTRLEELCLQIKLLKLGRIETFVGKAMQAPSMEALGTAIKTLQDLQALDQNEELLPLGVHLAKMPLDPHTGKMILFAAMFGCLSPVCTVAASLSFKDAFVIPLGQEAAADHQRKNLAKGSKSDHIMLINAFEGWEECKQYGERACREYCYENFLSHNTLQLLQKMTKQFGQILYDLGFLKTCDVHDKAANMNSDNLALVKAVICAGLYPNVAKIRKEFNPRSRIPKPPTLNLKDGKKVSIHPKSVNAKERGFSTKWMMYHKAMKTQAVNIFDCTSISPYPLLFFGGEIKSDSMMVDETEKHMVTVDQWISFFASPTIGQIVKDLRRELDKLLERKITSPGTINWNPNSKEGALIHAIIDLITMEGEDQDSGRRTMEEYDSQDFHDDHI